MSAMQPVWMFLSSLGGFEFAAFWIAMFTGVSICGFVLDYLLQRQGFGPYFNGVFVALGIFAGLYVRFNYLRGYQMQVHEPLLSLLSVFAVTGALLLGSAFLRNRLS